MGDWVVTPRRGKAVEINGLWYNALKLLEKWLRAARRDDEADRWAAAGRAGPRVVQSAILVRSKAATFMT